jgi:hypothetical protein
MTGGPGMSAGHKGWASAPRGLRARGELGRGAGARERNGLRGEGVSWARGRGKEEGWGCWAAGKGRWAARFGMGRREVGHGPV